MDHLLHKVEGILRVQGAWTDTILELHLDFAELVFELSTVIRASDEVRVHHMFQEEVRIANLNVDALERWIVDVVHQDEI